MTVTIARPRLQLARLIPVTFLGSMTFAALLVGAVERDSWELSVAEWLGAAAVLAALATCVAQVWWFRMYRDRRIEVFKDRLEVRSRGRLLHSATKAEIQEVQTVIPARNIWDPFAWVLPELGGVVLVSSQGGDRTILIEFAALSRGCVRGLGEQVARFAATWDVPSSMVPKSSVAKGIEVV